jgi:ParB family chromosome partitioning protein
MMEIGNHVRIKISEIKPFRYSVRAPDDEDLKDLIESIKQQGLLEPIIVRPTKEGYEVVAGNRRLAACRYLGWRTIPCIIRNLSDREAYEVMLIENVQRRSFNPIQEAEAYKRYVEEYGWGGIRELAKRIGKSEAHISHMLKLLEFPNEVIKEIKKCKISPAVAYELINLRDDEQIRLISMVVQHKLSRRDIRRIKKLRKSGFKFEDALRLVRIEGLEGGRNFKLDVMNKAIAILKFAMMEMDELIKKSHESEDLRRTLFNFRLSLHRLIDLAIVEKKWYKHEGIIPSLDPSRMKSKTIKTSIGRGTVELNLLIWTGPISRSLINFSRNFCHENPNIKINMLKLGRKSLYEMLIDEIVKEKNTYDIITYAMAWRPLFSPFLYDLNELLDDDEPYIEDFLKCVMTKFGKHDNSLVGIPIIIDPYVIYYRKDLFEDKEVKREFKRIYGEDLRPPETWEEVLTLCDFFNRTKKVSGLLYPSTQYNLPYSFANFMGDLRKRYISIYGPIPEDYGIFFDENKKPLLDSEIGIKAVDRMLFVKKYSEKGVDVTYDEALNRFNQGNAAMLLHWFSAIPQLTLPKDRIGIIEVPGYAPLVGGWCIAINKESRYPIEALKFIKYVTSIEAQILSFKRYYIGPSRISVYKRLYQDKLLRVVRNSISDMVHLPLVNQVEHLNNILGKGLFKILNGGDKYRILRQINREFILP